VADRIHLEGAIARAQGALDALTEAEEAPEVVEPDPTVEILEALRSELDKERRDAAPDLLNELSNEIAILAREFGIANVTDAHLDLGGRLKINKGGSSSWFSSLSPGERLRLRVATVVALLRVGARLGIATHPGILMVDSLRAEEVQDADAHALLEALLAVARSTSGLQIITTTADEHLAEGRLLEDHVLRPATAGGPLW